MNTAPWFTFINRAAQTDLVLARLGFHPVPGGYEKPPFHLRFDPPWCLMEMPCAEPAGDPLEVEDRAGLWKPAGTGARRRQVFSTLLNLIEKAATRAEPEAEDSPLEEWARWALLTAEGKTPENWRGPEPAQLNSWYTVDQLTVLAGSVIRQGEVCSQAGQLLLRFPILPVLPPELPASRQAWLRRLLAAGQEKCHLARLRYLRDGEETSVVAEINLTGAPSVLIENLFVMSLQTLRWVTQALSEPAECLADLEVRSELLARCLNQEP